MTRIFFYSTTGSFIGEGLAELDPRTGEPLLPGNATAKSPPSRKARFNPESSTWETPDSERREVKAEDVKPASAVTDLTDTKKPEPKPEPKVEVTPEPKPKTKRKRKPRK